MHRKGGHSKIVDKSVQISKKLAYLLRHGAEKEGLSIGQDGYVLLNQILSRHDFKGVTQKQIEDIVENNDKKRYELIKKVDGESGSLGVYIRATQGHSIKTVNDDDLLEQITDASQYPIVVHGTYQKNWQEIRKTGLNPMSRNHVHFAIGYPQQNEVISGMRKTCDVFIEINLEKALKSGMKWFISKNKVILSSGHNRCIEPLYFKKVLDCNGNVLFDGIDENWEEIHQQKQQQLQEQQQQQLKIQELQQQADSNNGEKPPVEKQASNLSEWEEVKKQNSNNQN